MIKVKALQPLVHNRINAERGDEFELEEGEANDMVSRGIAERVGGADKPQTGVTDSQEDDDLLGDTKAESAPENKMEKAPANKAKK